MRRFFVLVVLVATLWGLSVSADAATAAKSISSYATVAADGTCQVTLTATLHLDEPVSHLRFPLPEKSRNVTVNGARARSRVEDGLRQVNLSGVVGKAAGDFTLTFTYTLPNLVVTNDVGLLELQLPLLAGFAYPVQALEFSVTLPGPVTAKPAFSSGYHQANIEKDIYCTTSGATVNATAQVALKDHETLSMTLLVTEEMFPQTRFVMPNFQTVYTLTTVCFLLAAVYWVLFLRNLPSFPHRHTVPPEGYNAGELGSVLHLQGGNLNMMVFSWAQLGYLLIHLEHNGRVRLYRQMDMGNERSSFEQRCFRQLFGRQTVVDAGAVRYAEVYRDVQKLKPNMASLIHSKSGNLRVFQGLAALAGMFGGVCIAMGLSTGAALQWFLVIVLGALALWSSWQIQQWAVNLLVPDKRQLWLALGLCGGWLLVSALGGLFSLGLNMVLGQLIVGLFVALGGRRTAVGRQMMGEVLGLRRYLKTVPTERLQQICRDNPEYFHQMMPYAMALGVDKRFAKQFDKLQIGACPYVFIGTDSTMRATQWCGLMRRVLKGMRTTLPNTRLERLVALIESFMK